MTSSESGRGEHCDWQDGAVLPARDMGFVPQGQWLDIGLVFFRVCGPQLCLGP